MSSWYGDYIDDRLRAFRKSFSIRRKLKLSTIEPSKLKEYCERHDLPYSFAVIEVSRRGYEIFLCRRLSRELAIESLIHELAHVLDIERNGWGGDKWSEQHGPSWGIAYAEVYVALGEEDGQ